MVNPVTIKNAPNTKDQRLYKVLVTTLTCNTAEHLLHGQQMMRSLGNVAESFGSMLDLVRHNHEKNAASQHQH